MSTTSQLQLGLIIKTSSKVTCLQQRWKKSFYTNYSPVIIISRHSNRGNDFLISIHRKGQSLYTMLRNNMRFVKGQIITTV